jgi:hypothetical protein
MFYCDPNPQNWKRGVQAAFEGSSLEAVQMYLRETYSQSLHPEAIGKTILHEGNTSKCSLHDIILESLKLAHKLDNAHLQAVRRRRKNPTLAFTQCASSLHFCSFLKSI